MSLRVTVSTKDVMFWLSLPSVLMSFAGLFTVHGFSQSWGKKLLHFGGFLDAGT